MTRMRVLIIGAILIAGVAIAMFFFSRGRIDTPERVEAVSPSTYLKEAEDALRADDLLTAKKLYLKAKEEIDDSQKLKDIQSKIEGLNVRILFSPVIDECSAAYTVEAGDALAKIARKFHTTVNLIKRANGLETDVIVPGQKLKVAKCPFSIVIDKSQNLLLLKSQGEVIKTYIVSTGTNNSTPVGAFQIVNKLPNPTWFRTGAVIPPDSAENILGTRWMGFNLKGYGIHGTTEPQDLGKQVTMGCIRMRNGDVEELYDIVPVGTEVTIVD
jgi:lipoprotein-anchoring transpeptidase ErfK/SrfK